MQDTAADLRNDRNDTFFGVFQCAIDIEQTTSTAMSNFLNNIYLNL